MTKNEVLGAAHKAGMAFHLGVPHEAVMDQLTRFAEIVLADSPAWHDAPTMQGLWLSSISGEARQISVAGINSGFLTGRDVRWYGPIPEDKP